MLQRQARQRHLETRPNSSQKTVGETLNFKPVFSSLPGPKKLKLCCDGSKKIKKKVFDRKASKAFGWSFVVVVLQAISGLGAGTAPRSPKNASWHSMLHNPPGIFISDLVEHFISRLTGSLE